MNAKELAEKLNGCLYDKEVTEELEAQAKEDNLVIVFGASDDLMEFRGAIDDEIGAWEGTVAYLNSEGLLTNECGDRECPYWERKSAEAKKIEARWCNGGERPDWTYATDIPHETFDVMSDELGGYVYCRGIVFSLDDLEEAPQGLTPVQARIIAAKLEIYEGAEVFDDVGEVAEAYRALIKIAQLDRIREASGFPVVSGKPWG
jgi:hypothetical protein